MAAAPSRSAVVFHDDFGGDNAGVSADDYTAFAQWTVTGGQVDLVHDKDVRNGVTVRCSGGCINLRGSQSFASIVARSPFAYAAGDRFTLSVTFTLDPVGLPDESLAVALAPPAGNPGTSSPQFLNVSDDTGTNYGNFVDALGTFYDPDGNTPTMQTRSLFFTMGNAGTLALTVYSIFDASQPIIVFPTDRSGPLLDSITLSVDRAGPIPEPSIWALTIAGFGAIGAVTRRRRAPLVA